ncbi:MAG: restriction endonuclease subunit S [Actinomycetota bacterium]|nr:restriction endonuclease subunit S [Actinomycetota bacterium]MDP9331524.1 restriction endonuclease subunit S [Actinomycetota bacterium]
MSQFHSDWPEMTLGDVSDKPQYGWSARSSAQGSAYRYLRITDMTSGQLDWGTVPFCVDIPPDPNRFLLRDEDILVARSGATFGRSIRIRDPERALFASYLIRLRPDTGVVMPAFLEGFLKSPAYWRQVRASSSGMAQPNVNAKKLAQIRIPIPPLDEQERIVAALEEQFSRLDALEGALVSVLRKTGVDIDTVRLQHRGGLRAVVLRDAFTGRLTS